MNRLALVRDGEDERRRRGLLAESDRLLGRVEELRLDEASAVPAELGAAIAALNRRLGRSEGRDPRSVRAAQQLVFSVQQRLMALNPRVSQPRAHSGRAAGVPAVAPLARGGAWKFLVLPPRGPRPESEWRELVELTVERAWDRWVSAQGRAVAIARAGRRREAARALQRAAAAWWNYFELRREAELLLGLRRDAA